MIFALAACAAFLMLALRLIYAYRGLCQLHAGIESAWTALRASQRVRHLELPRLVGSCRRHLAVEPETFARVQRARAAVLAAGTAGDIAALGAAEQRLHAALRHVLDLADAAPALCGDPEFLRLRRRIAALDCAIRDHGEAYNERANLNNIRIRIAPMGPLAGRLGFHPAPLLELPSDRIEP